MRDYVDWRPFEYFTCRLSATGRLGIVMPPGVETMDFVAIDGGGTRVEHRFRAEKRSGISYLVYRASMLLFRAGVGSSASMLKTVMDEDAAALEDEAFPHVAPESKEDTTHERSSLPSG